MTRPHICAIEARAPIPIAWQLVYLCPAQAAFLVVPARRSTVFSSAATKSLSKRSYQSELFFQYSKLEQYPS